MPGRNARMLCLLAVAAASGAIALATASPAAAKFKPGTILVADGNSGVLLVDPGTGKQRILSSNDQPVNASSQLFSSPSDIALSRSGRVFVTDYSAFSDFHGGVIEIDPVTGKQKLISSNLQPVNAASPLFGQPDGIALLPDGRILVSDRSAFGGGGVIAVDPKTGKQSVFSSNTQAVNAASQLFADPRGGIMVARSGKVLVGDASTLGSGGVISIDPVTGKQSILSSNLQPVNAASQYFEIPVGVAESADARRLYVADQEAFADGGIVGVDPKTGKQSLVSSDGQPVNAPGGDYVDPFDLAFSRSGHLLLADPSAFGDVGCMALEGCGGLIDVNPVTGKQRPLSTNLQPVNASSQLYGGGPFGLAVVPPRCAGRAATIVGTPGKDRIPGTSGPDVITGQSGADVIKGRGGKDVICGGKGRDRLSGGPGADKITGGPGLDVLRGGAGKDRQKQ